MPDCDIFQLPMLYGQDARVRHAQGVRRQGRCQLHHPELEHKLRSHVLGPWLDLGYQNWYTTSKPITHARRPQGHEDPQPRRRRHRLAHPFGAASPTPPPGPTCRLRCRRARSTDSSAPTRAAPAASSGRPASGIPRGPPVHRRIHPHGEPRRSGTSWRRTCKKMMTDLWEQNIAAYRENMLRAR